METRLAWRHKTLAFTARPGVRAGRERPSLALAVPASMLSAGIGASETRSRKGGVPAPRTVAFLDMASTLWALARRQVPLETLKRTLNEYIDHGYLETEEKES